MSKNCPNCGADIDSGDYIDDDDKCICKSCGFVVANAGFADPVAQAAPTGENNVSRRQNGSSKFHYNSDREYQAAGHTEGRKSVNSLCGIMRYSSLIVDESLKLFDRVYMHDEFHFRQIKDKHVMAAVCVYITCRKYNWIVTMMSLCKVVGCRPKLFFKWKKLIVKAFDIDVSSVDLLELAKKCCIEAGLDVETMKKSVKILELCKDLCVSDNRIPEHLISAASYVAWISCDPLGRNKIKFKAYCTNHRFSCTRHAAKMVRVISGVMCRLAGELPWVSKEKVRTSNVSMHINDIIKYQTTLMSDSRAKYVASLGLKEEDDSLSADEEDISLESDDESLDIPLQIERSESVEQNSSRPLLINTVNENIDRSSIIEKDNSNEMLPGNSLDKVERLKTKLRNSRQHLKNLNQADSLLFSVKRKKPDSVQHGEPAKDLPSHDMDDEELCNEDISDNELSLYIKSDNELLAELGN